MVDLHASKEGSSTSIIATYDLIFESGRISVGTTLACLLRLLFLKIFFMKSNISLNIDRTNELPDLSLGVPPARDVDLGSDNLDDFRSNYRADLAANLKGHSQRMGIKE